VIVIIISKTLELLTLESETSSKGICLIIGHEIDYPSLIS
jgi:hypothetical protein